MTNLATLYIDGVRAVTAAVESHSVEVDDFGARYHGARPPEGHQLVWQAWAKPVTFYAAPWRARIWRLWAQGRWAYKPIHLLRSLGFLRFTPGTWNARWSYPFRRKDVMGNVTPFESRVLGHIYKWRQRWFIWRTYGA